MPDFETKDSGARQEYGSGMVRDLQTGKPRFDLLVPLIEGMPFDEHMLTRVAMLMDRGAQKYGYRNWERATSQEEVDRFRASALRHMMQWIAGEADEDHAAAVIFNLIAAITTEWKVDTAARGLAREYSDRPLDLDGPVL